MGNETTRLLPSDKFAAVDGTNHNPNQKLNATNTGEVRLAPANFAPNTSNTPVDGPNPREISNVLSSGPNADNHDPSGLSAWMYVWGQFIDHDLDRTPQDSTHHIDIPIPKDDPTYPNSDPISLTRFTTDSQSGTAVNAVTGWIDGSMIYGSDQASLDSVRLSDGHLKTSQGSNLPIADGTFYSGDIRAAENPDLTAISALFVREHNYQVDRLAKQHPDWSGDQLFQMARAIVTAEIQNITYSEFLPHLLGNDAIPHYQGFDPNADPRITQEFTTAAFRFGHSIVSDEETKLSNMGDPMASQDLGQAFMDTPDQVKASGGVDALIRNFSSDPTQANDTFAIDSLRNLLVAPPDFIDLIAIDIQRERDLGIGTLNQTRQALGLTPYTDFNQITSDHDIAAKLQQQFGSVDNVDLFMGGLAEDHADGAMVGTTFKAILTDQFTNLRDGDQLWWQNEGFDPTTKKMIQHTSLSDIIMRDTDTQAVQPDVFVAEDRHPSDETAEEPDKPQLVMGKPTDGASVIGGPADDTIVAGLGKNQTLTGGGGHNVFVFSYPNETATITDFNPKMDKVEFHMASGDFNVTSADGHAVLNYRDERINLLGVTPDQLSSTNYLFLPQG